MKTNTVMGEFALTSRDFDDENFTDYFKLNLDQFRGVHYFVKYNIDGEECKVWW